MTWPCRRTRRMTRAHFQRERAIHAYAVELASRLDADIAARKRELAERAKAHAHARSLLYDRVRRAKVSSADVAASQGRSYEATGE